MNKKKLLSIATLLLSFVAPFSAQAETVIERIRDTGTLNAGVRKDGFPLTFEQNQQWQGYSVDLIKLIQKQLEQELKKPIKINFVGVTTENRIPQVLSNTVDIVCDFTTFDWHSSRFIDFSVPYFLTGTQLLVKANSGFNSIDSLQLKKIGVIANSANELVIMQTIKQGVLLPLNNGNEGFLALQRGEIDAFAWDGILLYGLLKNLPNTSLVKIIPELPLERQLYSCLLPENNSDFNDIVNYTVVKLMEDIVEEKPEAVAVIKRWFGNTSYLYLLNYLREELKYKKRIPANLY